MPKGSMHKVQETRQLALLLNAQRIVNLDAGSRAVVVKLLARLLREAASKPERLARESPPTFFAKSRE